MQARLLSYLRRHFRWCVLELAPWLVPPSCCRHCRHLPSAPTLRVQACSRNPVAVQFGKPRSCSPCCPSCCLVTRRPATATQSTAYRSTTCWATTQWSTSLSTRVSDFCCMGRNCDSQQVWTRLLRACAGGAAQWSTPLSTRVGGEVLLFLSACVQGHRAARHASKHSGMTAPLPSCSVCGCCVTHAHLAPARLNLKPQSRRSCLWPPTSCRYWPRP